jgi:hypothetical protein
LEAFGNERVFRSSSYDNKNGNVVPFTPQWSTTYGKITQQVVYTATLIPGYAIVAVKPKAPAYQLMRMSSSHNYNLENVR